MSGREGNCGGLGAAYQLFWDKVKIVCTLLWLERGQDDGFLRVRLGPQITCAVYPEIARSIPGG